MPMSDAHLSWRPRRLRRTAELRRLVRETTLAPADFIYPLFVTHHDAGPVPFMPGIERLNVTGCVRAAREAAALGVAGVLLFGIPEQKDAIGSAAKDPMGPVTQAVRALKAEIPELVVITDVCLCSYTDHGHCGVLSGSGISNDATLPILADMACVHAEAGADIVAPSGMMDHMVAAIRSGLDAKGYADVAILSYSAKYASAFYGPFRHAAGGAPQFGDRKTHQLDPSNVREALREVAHDVREGADMIMVKPALSYLDVISRVRARIPDVPLVAYNVSGEYAMVKAAVNLGLAEEQSATLEVLTSIKRAGADSIITYHALEAAAWLQS